MKKRLRHAVVALIVVLLSAGTFLLTRTLWSQREADIHQQVLDILPQVAQRIRDFHRTKVTDGRKEWEVSAREAQYYDEEQVAVVSEPAVSFFGDDGREVVVRGREGKVYLGDRELRKVEVEGDILVKFGQYALRTDLARYDRERDAIVSPGEVKISGEDFDIRGDAMTIQLTNQRLQVKGNVLMILRPGA